MSDYVLVITDKGAEVVAVPSYPIEVVVDNGNGLEFITIGGAS